MSTGTAKEFGLTATIGFLDMPTASALLAGIFRVHKKDRNTRSPRLVADEGSQLCESPIAVSCALVRPSNPGPRANARQVFQGNCTVRAFGGFNESLADLMVHVFLETPLASRQFSQVAFGRQASTRLQIGTQLLLTLTVLFDGRAGHHLAIAGCGNVSHAQIDPQSQFNITRFGIGDVARCQQKEHTIPVDQVRFALPILKQFALAFARAIGDKLTTVDRPDGYRVFFGVPGQNAVIVGYCAVRFEGALALPVQFVGVGYFRRAPHDHLCGQFCFLADGMVQRVMQVVLAKNVIIPSVGTDAVAGSIGPFKRLLEGDSLFFRRVKAHLRNQFHSWDYTSFHPKVQV